MSDHLPPSLRLASNDDAIALLTKYYAREKPFVGATFDAWESPHCAQSTNAFTADDVLAVNFLSVAVPPMATKRLLVTDPNRFNGLLERIPAGQSFWGAGVPEPDSPQWQLEKELLALHGVGMTIASKLMARKRPHLIPISDSVVRRSLGLKKSFWKPLYDVFADDDFRGRLLAIREETGRRDDVLMPEGLSLLRVFDVIAWMDGKKVSTSPLEANGWPDQPLTSE